MNRLSYKTSFLNKETVKKDWVILDAQDQILGRFASKVAFLLRGKHKPGYTPFVDCGDNVIIINASKVRLTGKKWTEKEYVTYTGYPGGQRFSTPKSISQKHPKRVMEWAVRGMLPKNRLGRKLFTNLYVYEGAEHPHQAQNPKLIKL
ncbi:MAG: 50S ribosomal protein L13 [Cytophagaceae bacterium]|nr:50S ribosomal protein L13 [Cytophagaceae bacterium]MDW8456238.1 50S ribosomal protein L13 [Cytophagaceae bacterium]